MFEFHEELRKDYSRRLSQANFEIGWLKGIIRDQAYRMNQSDKVDDLLKRAEEAAREFAQRTTV